MSAPLENTKGYSVILKWLSSKNYKPFPFQQQTWQYIINGHSGLVNAPTGCGKTFSVFLGAVIDFINHHPIDYKTKRNAGLQLLWITPLKALAKDIDRAMEEVIAELGMQWKIGIRNGDTDTTERARQKKQMPEVLIITPESLHLLLAQKNCAPIFESLKIIAVDEWHELLGSKRGVQVELAISRIVNSQLSGMNSKPLCWGISATIGNLEQAKEVLLAPLYLKQVSVIGKLEVSPIGTTRQSEDCKRSSLEGAGVIVKADLKKLTEVQSIIPDEIEKYPWAGHLGIKLAYKIIPVILQSKTTLIFINTRGMSETWYQTLLNICPDLAGSIALHHGSIDMELRQWVEENLHSGNLKAVVCTASLDLGVDFRPVETVIQVGSPKGVARFLQRAGRSGHSPDAVSKIYFLPTHSLELIEAAALKNAIKENLIESREPMMLCYDVLIQYLNTLAISDGFLPDEIFNEVVSTYCYHDLTKDEWEQILYFITVGGNALQQYDDYRKTEIENGVYKINSRKVAMRHRLHIGTIVSEAMMKVKFMSGGYVGVIEEWFISRLEQGDVFTLAGRNLEFIMIKDMTALVRKSDAKKSMVPSWQGGRMPLSANLGKKLREQLAVGSWQLADNINATAIGYRSSVIGSSFISVELEVLKPLFELQQQLSHVPKENELLIEQIATDDGFHLFVYPFEGRLVHEAMAAILAYRISRITPITFSFAMNDYGFELLSDQPIPVDDSNVYELFSPENLLVDIQRSVNATEMARRKFRDVAVIGGLVFQGYPGEQKKARHLQASASLLFNVFSEYEPGNLLLRQSYQEVMDQQMEEVRLRDMLHRIQQSTIVITFPEQLTPFCFPVKVDSMREDLSSEKLEDRVRKMQQQLEAAK
jgi:ATP-dependent helicase Lhr and Lhr-like helicase